jgi:hypothetical protein
MKKGVKISFLMCTKIITFVLFVYLLNFWLLSGLITDHSCKIYRDPYLIFFLVIFVSLGSLSLLLLVSIKFHDRLLVYVCISDFSMSIL